MEERASFEKISEEAIFRLLEKVKTVEIDLQREKKACQYELYEMQKDYGDKFEKIVRMLVSERF